MADDWQENAAIGTLRAEDLGRAGVCFRYARHLYQTTGHHISNGGMGAVYEMRRRDDVNGTVEDIVGKVFQQNYLHQLRTDEVTRRDHHANLAAMTRISALEHPNILPTYVSTPIGDNYLFVTPRMGVTLLEAVAKHNLSPRARVKLLIQALEGLQIMHQARLIHRDFTLRNILLDAGANVAVLFDFDLAVSLDDVGPTTYRQHYKGRVFGSPGWSVAPETVEGTMLDLPLAPTVDIFAIGGALHGLFTDKLVYGAADDMWALLTRIAEGVVISGRSSVHYPEAVPASLRPIIEACLERDPSQRFPRVATVIHELRGVLRNLDDDLPGRKSGRAFKDAVTVSADDQLAAVLKASSDPSVTRDDVYLAESALRTWGYGATSVLGRVRNHIIVLATPRPELLAAGTFPDPNTFPKLVTRIDLARIADPVRLVEHWQQHYWPILRRVRQGLLTSLHKVIYDSNTNSLLLFSEYVDAPRFGSRLGELDLHIDGAIALGLLVIRQVAALHEHGMAHNNVHPGALLFKGSPETRALLPAMIGLVEPAMGIEAMAGDCRAIAGMLLTWLRPARIAALSLRIKPSFEATRSTLTAWAFDRNTPAPNIDELAAVVSDAFALIDFNYSVLRDSGGDLQEYALMIVSLRLYHLLWPVSSDSETAARARV